MEFPPLKNIYTCFPGGKHKVLTMSYDDGRDEDRRLVALFNQYGIRGTFNLNAGLHTDGRIPLQEYKALYKGHEVACHTYLHPTIARCPSEQVVEQVLQDRRVLEEMMGAPVRGLAYPNGSYSPAIMALLPSLGIRYARTVAGTDGFALPDNFMAWAPTCHHNHNLLALGQQFTALHKTQYLYMLYVWGHSYEFTQRNNWQVMESFCEMVGGQPDIWYATNIEIVDYMEAAARLQFTAAGSRVYNPSYTSVWLEVDGTRQEIPGGSLVDLGK
ncbi:MAG: polysaccharide deacetylase family protein [Gemmiger sp.]|nr:polysaccharide deacetylase family protein [Gemmiger sp.]